MGYSTYNIADLIEEIAMGPFGSNIKVECFVDSGIPVLNGSNLDGFSLSEREFRYVTPEKADSLKKANASRGDVVITHRGTLGQIVYIPETSNFDRYVISQSQFRVRCNEKVLPEYMVYYFHTNVGRHKLLSNASQVGVPALARPSSTFQQIEIEIPDIDTQKRVVEIINTLQKKIDCNNKINDNLQQQIFTLFQAEYQHPKENEVWQNGCIGDVVNLQRGFDLPKDKVVNGIYPVAGSTDTIAYHSDFTTEPPCIVIGRSGNIGNPRLYLHRCWAHNTTLFSKEYKNSNPYWVYAMLKFIDYRQFQGGSAVPTLNRNHVHAFFIDIPSKTKQDEFGEFASALFDMIMKNDEESKNLCSIRDSLLPKLMSGKIDVSDIQL